MPNSRQTSVIASPSSTRATKHRRSSITELAFHGINTSRQKAKSVTHVSGTKCHLCLRPYKSTVVHLLEQRAQPVPAIGRHVVGGAGFQLRLLLRLGTRIVRDMQ